MPLEPQLKILGVSARDLPAVRPAKAKSVVVPSTAGVLGGGSATPPASLHAFSASVGPTWSATGSIEICTRARQVRKLQLRETGAIPLKHVDATRAHAEAMEGEDEPYKGKGGASVP